MTIVPLLAQAIDAEKAISMNTSTSKDSLKVLSMTKHPDREPHIDDLIKDDPTSVKDITLKKEFIANNEAFFAVVDGFLQGEITDIDTINAMRKKLNKGIRIIHDMTENGKKVARYAVVSFFDKEKDKNSDKEKLVLKNISDITDDKTTYDAEATIENIVYKSEEALLFVTDDKEYNYNIILRAHGEIAIIPKSHKSKLLKANTNEELANLELLLKEIFPPAFITERDQAMEARKEKGQKK